MDVHYSSSNSINSISMMADENDDDVLIQPSKDVNTELYPYRWFILFLYSLTAFSNTLVWLSLFTVTDATSAFYGIKEEYLIWSSVASSVMQCFIAIPFSFLPSRLGLRTSMVIAAAINAIGSCVIIAGAHKGGFTLFISGQVIIAVAASILPQIAPEVSAVWFGKNEHAISTSIGITVGNAGAAFGFLQPALFLKNVDPRENIDYVGTKIKQVIYSQAGLCLLMLVLVSIFFTKKPKSPPTISQAIRPGPGLISFQEFKNNCKELISSPYYILSANIFALSTMITFIVPVVLNQIIAWKFPHQDATVGWMGFGGIIAGIFGSVIFSLILDKTKAFKMLNVIIATISLVMWVLFVELLAHVTILWLTVMIFVVALFLFIPFGPVLVDTMVELTYPIPESASFAIALTGSRLYSIPITFVIGYLIDKGKYYIASHMFTAVLALCLFLTLILKVDQKRSEATLRIDTINDIESDQLLDPEV